MTGNKKLQGKVAIITGGTTGICSLMAAEGKFDRELLGCLAAWASFMNPLTLETSNADL
jgi:hypothetical protein